MINVGRRIYSDYLMADRTAEYEVLLRAAIGAGYALLSVRDFIALGQVAPPRIMVLRHDIDTDPVTARRLFEIESSLGVRASYYFRLTTLDTRLMVDIEAYGSEASYHFEEIADFVKLHDIRCPRVLRSRIGEVEDRFFINFTNIERRTGIKLHTVASHGDFANRKLGIINHELLQNATLRRRCGITHEAYDAALMQRFDIYISDRACPELYSPCSPLHAFDKHQHIYFTSHPVHWRTNWRASSRHNLTRLFESWSW